MTGPTFSIKLGEEEYEISDDYKPALLTFLVALERVSEIDLG